MAAPGPHGPASCNASLSTFQQQMWPVLVVEFFLAFAGNAFAIYHFVAHERTWHTGIVYSFNLAVSDLLYALSLPFLAIYYYPPKHWPYGLALCKLERFLFSCNLLFLAAFGCGLPFLLTLFSYGAIFRTVCRNPHLTPLEKRQVRWLVSVGVALYAVSYLPYHTLRNLNLSLRQRHPKGPAKQHVLLIHSAYQLSKLLVTLNICTHPLLCPALADSMRAWCRGPRRQDRGQPAENMALKACG
ncbi:P2Y purinoceptor 11 [Chelonia mydas]|uniref:p2Y purinoceptor 11 n=1 Tax=Chelonia mydas TaxID=8469 RepID=M7AKN7_CHEMY|nr:P2Y purinoceptor 11 [Chelonia mydas]